MTVPQPHAVHPGTRARVVLGPGATGLLGPVDPRDAGRVLATGTIRQARPDGTIAVMENDGFTQYCWHALDVEPCAGAPWLPGDDGQALLPPDEARYLGRRGRFLLGYGGLAGAGAPREPETADGILLALGDCGTFAVLGSDGRVHGCWPLLGVLDALEEDGHAAAG